MWETKFFKLTCFWSITCEDCGLGASSSDSDSDDDEDDEDEDDESFLSVVTADYYNIIKLNILAQMIKILI